MGYVALFDLDPALLRNEGCSKLPFSQCNDVEFSNCEQWAQKHRRRGKRSTNNDSDTVKDRLQICGQEDTDCLIAALPDETEKQPHLLAFCSATTDLAMGWITMVIRPLSKDGGFDSRPYTDGIPTQLRVSRNLIVQAIIVSSEHPTYPQSLTLGTEYSRTE